MTSKCSISQGKHKLVGVDWVEFVITSKKCIEAWGTIMLKGTGENSLFFPSRKKLSGNHHILRWMCAEKSHTMHEGIQIIIIQSPNN